MARAPILVAAAAQIFASFSKLFVEFLQIFRLFLQISPKIPLVVLFESNGLRGQKSLFARFQIFLASARRVFARRL
jgi:hypothetical protein